MASWLARRDRQRALGRNGNGIGTPLPIAIALLPTPIAHDAHAAKPHLGGHRPSGAWRQIQLTDVIIHRLAGNDPAEWGEYASAIRRWEDVLGHPAPPPADPGPRGRPRLSVAFTEWMMGLFIGVKCLIFLFLQFRAC